MSKFNDTLWNNTDFSKSYLDESSMYLPYRGEIIDLLLSYIEHFFPKDKDIKFAELGSGDGYIADKILSNNRISEAFLIDGSEQMLSAAKKRLKRFDNIEYKHISFQSLLNNNKPLAQADLIFSSLAIHHLTMIEKEKLYKWVFDSLSEKGRFINYDVVLPASSNLEKWYLNVWKNWILGTGQTSEKIINTPQQYKDNSDNIPDPLEKQLTILKRIGFKEVECYFKFGIFAVFGGLK